MPQFLKSKLKQEYGDNDSAVYGTMNKIGAMHGNKETAKGRTMQAKHNAKAKKKGHGPRLAPVPAGKKDPGPAARIGAMFMKG